MTSKQKTNEVKIKKSTNETRTLDESVKLIDDYIGQNENLVVAHSVYGKIFYNYRTKKFKVEPSFDKKNKQFSSSREAYKYYANL